MSRRSSAIPRCRMHPSKAGRSPSRRSAPPSTRPVAPSRRSCADWRRRWRDRRSPVPSSTTWCSPKARSGTSRKRAGRSRSQTRCGPAKPTGSKKQPAPSRTSAANTRIWRIAVFAEVKVDEQLGVIRVTHVVSAVAAGRILNPKLASSQILGAVVGSIGMALHEETVNDHRFGRFMSHNLADYHVPVNADVHAIDVIFVEEKDDEINPLGVKGVGEIGIVGTAAAVANAVYHATGKRVRDLPITLDKLMQDQS